MQQLIFLYNHINVLFYLLQHKLYLNLSFYYDQFNLLKLLSLFFIGIFTSLTPCFISIVPLIVSSTTTLRDINGLKKIFLFVGLSTSLVIIIFVLYLSNGKFDKLFINIPLISSFIFIYISLNFLEIISFASLNKYLSIEGNTLKNIYLQSYLTGFGIGLSCLPCNCSLIVTTILWLYNPDKIIESLIYLLIYIFSSLFPFLVIFFFPLKLLKLQNFIYIWDKVIKFGGFYMLTFGFFILFQQLL